MKETPPGLAGQRMLYEKKPLWGGAFLKARNIIIVVSIKTSKNRFISTLLKCLIFLYQKKLTMTNPLKTDALSLLQTALNNPNAEFRTGQWEAISELIENQSRLLVVQRTGWGKNSN